MYSTNFWGKLHIYSKKTIVGVILLVAFTGKQAVAQSQQSGEVNLPFYDDKRMHYGFTLGMNSARYRLVHSNQFLGSDTLSSVLSPGSPGFSLGFILNLKLEEYFDLRLLPTVSFYERRVEYGFIGGAVDEQIIESTFIEFPLLLKYKSQRRGNMRVYAVGGVKAGIEAGAKKRDKTDDQLRANNMDFAIEYGAGFDFYFQLFKFSPEIRLSHGLVNLLSNDPNIYSRSLNRMNTHTVSLFLHFE